MERQKTKMEKPKYKTRKLKPKIIKYKKYTNNKFIMKNTKKKERKIKMQSNNEESISPSLFIRIFTD